MTSYIEAMGIDLGPYEEQFCREAKLYEHESERFLFELHNMSDTIINFCRDCGFWFLEYFEPVSDEGEIDQHIIQMSGCIAKFHTADDIPINELATYISLRRANLGDITPVRFEHLVGEFLRSEWRDAEVHHVGCAGGGGYGGVDFIIITTEKDYLVQVKCHADPRKKEGVKFIRELNGAILREGTQGSIFVTSATGYTRAAITEVEQTKGRNPFYEFFMIDRIDLKKWIKKGESSEPWRKYLYDAGREESGLTYRLRQKLANEGRKIIPVRNLDPDEEYYGNIRVYR
jgi:hypothetical protein